jgi:outer membrane protein TolC
MKKLLLSILTTGLTVSIATAQTMRTMTLDELYAIADSASQSIRSYTTAHAASTEAVAAAKSAMLPDVNVSLSGSYLGDGYLMNRHFGEGKRIDMPHWGNNFSLAASQVLYAGGAISAGIRMAELGEQMAALDLQKNRQEVRFLLTGYYLELYKLGNQVKVLDQNIALTRQVLRNMEARREQGTVLKNDITRYELQLQTLELQKVKLMDGLHILNQQLVTTLHLPADTRIAPDTTLLNMPIERLTENEWLTLADNNNISLQQATLAHEISQQELKATRAASLPSLALVAEDHMDGPITIEVPTIDMNYNYWFVGLGVKYQLSSLWKNNRNLRKAKLNVRRAQENIAVAHEGIDNGIQAAYTNFLTSFTEVRTQEKSVELADQNYTVTANRYDNDLALLTDMLDASNMKLSASLNLVNARINLIYNYYKLKYTASSL